VDLDPWDKPQNRFQGLCARRTTRFLRGPAFGSTFCSLDAYRGAWCFAPSEGKHQFGLNSGDVRVQSPTGDGLKSGNT
jgi:hypothetical protein